ncbi:hypothetical protein Bca4012_090536 [Brassica carinata]|uniref:F-box domain-containing protein n=2 Tax=Brassica TaxID=3705 RepID=A0A3P6FUY6_BRAOL|nr:F-box protein At3g17710-like [Brassica napus]VDD52326.1 unnamed protein product [Brassica oleracea]
MALVNLPWELVEEIISRIPPECLVRFRVVCKQWNNLFHEKRFIKTQLDHACPQFVLFDQNKIFLIDVNLDDLAIQMHQISVDIPCVLSMTPFITTYCDGLLICDLFFNGTAVWNPLLRRGRQIMTKNIRFKLCGIGYDSNRSEISYKLFGYHYYYEHDYKLEIYECASNTWKYINAPYEEWPIKEPLDNHISLGGNSYWTAYNIETSEYLIRKFDFSKEILKNFCILPCKKNHEGDTHYLSVFRGNRFSMLEQCYGTKEIEIWVTTKKIQNGDEENVVWVRFMNVSIPEIPRLFHQSFGRCPSYFVDYMYGKSFVLCCTDENRQGSIYILRGGFSRKIKIDSMGVDFNHFIYVPSFTPIP